MDIATLLESHRRYMLEAASTLYAQDEAAEGVDGLNALGNLHDRASVKALLDAHRTASPTLGTYSAAQNVAPEARGPKPGSKAARARAVKAAETRRRNREAAAQAKDAQEQLTSKSEPYATGAAAVAGKAEP